MNNDDNLDLLDLNDDTDTLDDSLPDAAPFTNPRPRRPWLLLAVGVLIIILATYIIIRTIGDDSSSSMQVDLDAPAIVVEDGGAAIPAPVNSAPAPVNVAPAPQPAPAPQTGPQPVAQPASAPQPAQPAAGPAPQNTTSGVPVRVIEDRRDVRFNPEQAQPAAKPAPAPQPQQPARRQQAQSAQTTPRASGWYVQFGSYSTRALAEAGQRQLQNGHRSLFSGRQFVILAAVLPNGSTTYRLRIAFDTSANANAFCRNAKSDGVDCYVTK